jgi:hypothetical protein
MFGWLRQPQPSQQLRGEILGDICVAVVAAWTDAIVRLSGNWHDSEATSTSFIRGSGAGSVLEFADDAATHDR